MLLATACLCSRGASGRVVQGPLLFTPNSPFTPFALFQTDAIIGFTAAGLVTTACPKYHWRPLSHPHSDIAGKDSKR